MNSVSLVTHAEGVEVIHFGQIQLIYEDDNGRVFEGLMNYIYPYSHEWCCLNVTFQGASDHQVRLATAVHQHGVRITSSGNFNLGGKLIFIQYEVESHRSYALVVV